MTRTRDPKRPENCRLLGLRRRRRGPSKEDGCQASWQLVVSCAVLVLLTLGATANGKTHRHDFTEKQRVYLAVQALSRAVAGGHSIDRAMLAPLIPEANRGQVLQEVQTLSAKLKAGSVRGIESNRAQFSPAGARSKGDGYVVDGGFAVNASGHWLRTPVTINVATVNGYPVIQNAPEVIAAASALVDSILDPDCFLPTIDMSGQRQVNRQAHGALLSPVAIHNGSSRFNSSLSNAWFDGHDIFSRPYAVFCMEWDDGYLNWLDREFTMISDANWDRIIASSKCFDNDDHDWLQAVGSHGNGTLQFAFPSGFAFMNQKWMVGDGYNHRAMVYNMDNWETGEFTFDYELSEGFGIISDVASAYRPTGTLWPSMADFAILDRDNCHVYTYDYQGNPENSFFYPGAGPGGLDNPTSLAYCRYDIDGYGVPFLYVADDGNKRIDLVDVDQGVYTSSENDFPDDAYLSSVAVDPFSNVWVVDSYHGQIYMLSPNLTTVYAVIGEIGAADDQFYYPTRLATAEGWYCPPPPGGDVLEPIALGDLLITERWGSQTGVRRYVIDCRIDSTWLQYQCQPNDYSADYLNVEWSQAGYSTASMAIYHEGVQLWEWNGADVILGPGVFSPGSGYQFPVDAPDGWYHYSLSINSLFGPTSLTVWDSMFVERHLCCDSGVYASRFEADDPTGELDSRCYYLDDDRFWRCIINARDSCGGDSVTLFMDWQSVATLYPDTTQAPVYEFITRQANDEADTIFFKITSFPSGHSNGSLAEILRLRMIAEPDPFYNDTLYWWEFPWDSVSVYGNLYRRACETPCTPDCGRVSIFV